VVLGAAIRGDIEPRVVALHTLAAVDSGAAETVPVLIQGLADPDVRLRRAAASGLVRFGPDARPAIPELRRALSSTDQDLRLAAAEAILAIERPARLKDL
jgi:HEAT repeat protein